MPFQFGVGANGKNDDLGLSGWFYYEYNRWKGGGKGGGTWWRPVVLATLDSDCYLCK